MGKVIGVGGVFMTCADPAATKEWYTRVLGFEADDHGGFSFLHGDSAAAFPDGARTIFAPFEADSDYLAPSTLPFMLNLIVDDIDAVLARCEAEGVAQVKPMETFEYGRFAWIMDPDGRKLELWQPPS
ncbi:VOC family protein [Jannaschia sp. CCS1]|uniref:VOC family protein n=1 Tax=Jannaschia sp. (strain CCS1) TaxID=290400 RepID=UPI000053C29D|nr:VOC family protein [Jannaschia sp. CCS1]